MAENNNNENKQRRDREIRDIFKRLTKAGFRSNYIMTFMKVNYFIDQDSVYRILANKTDEPIDLADASLIYKIAIQRLENAGIQN